MSEPFYCCATYGGHICYQAPNHDGPHICGDDDHPCRATWTDEDQ